MKIKHIPILLIYSRILVGITIGLTAIINPISTGLIIAFLMFTGILTDIFDGVIARKLKVDSKRLRTMDSNVDLFFWTVAVVSVFGLNWDFTSSNILLISIVAALEILAYLISFLKFNRPIATHTYLAKFWSILLFLFLVELVVFSQSQALFHLVIWIGIVSRIEISSILLLSKEWRTDVSSIFKLNQPTNKKV